MEEINRKKKKEKGVALNITSTPREEQTSQDESMDDKDMAILSKKMFHFYTRRCRSNTLKNKGSLR